MNIEFSYEIVSVNETGRCMEVRYTSEGRETMLVGARLPFEGETLDDIVRGFSPVSYWLEKERQCTPVAVGATGQLEYLVWAKPCPLEACKAESKQRLFDTDWSQVADVAAILANKAEFDAYRDAVRSLYFNPVAQPVWREPPEAQWL